MTIFIGVTSVSLTRRRTDNEFKRQLWMVDSPRLLYNLTYTWSFVGNRRRNVNANSPLPLSGILLRVQSHSFSSRITSIMESWWSHMSLRRLRISLGNSQNHRVGEKSNCTGSLVVFSVYGTFLWYPQPLLTCAAGIRREHSDMV